MSIVLYVVIGFVILFLFSSINILMEYERGVIFTLGRFWKIKGPGLIIVVPIVQRIMRVGLRTIVMDVPSQDVISRDNVSVRVNAVVYFRVVDPEKAIIQVEDDLSINPYDLDGEMLVQAKLLGWYGQLEEEIMSAKKVAKARWHDKVEDICDVIRIKEENDDTPVGKRLKESDLKRRANRNKKVRAYIAEYMALSSKQRALSSYLRALTERGRMLQSMNKKQAIEHHQTR